MRLSTPLAALKGIGPKRAAALARAGLRTAGHLLTQLPARYEDRRRLSRIGDVEDPGERTFRARLSGMRRVRLRRRGLSLVRGTIDDGSGKMPAVWFNRPYLAGQIDESVDYLLHGEVRRRGERLELVNAACERFDRARAGRAVVPVYPAVGGVGPGLMRALMDQIWETLDPEAVPEPLPEALLRRRGLPPLGEALRRLHRPDEDSDVEALNARRSAAHQRLVYGELLRHQIEISLVRAEVERRRKPHRYRRDVEGALRSIPPFRLTGAQERALDEILADLGRRRPMLRLLQGDVGSGKTVVAALALAAAAESGLQGALMAPTEVLAEQHHRTLGELLGDRYRIVLLTGSAAEAAEGRERLGGGDAQLAVGTHALLQGGVDFARLGLAVIDEQHRFGVAQRRELLRKGTLPDLLVMTATPIPRSLTLTLYGDLDASVIDELPPGRRSVATRVRPAAAREAVLRWLDGRLRQGGQAYVVLPLIEESERVEAESIERRGAELRRRLSTHRAAILHGRTPAADREAILRAFAAGEIRLLISTTVVEVGLDVPAADTMVIESAERFGLSQLHQLRGRVGRGERPAVCVALHGRLSGEAGRRLEVFASTTDGFRIAEADLEIRGPGDVLGTRQSGALPLRVADLATHRAWLEAAREDALQLARDPEIGGDLRRRIEAGLAGTAGRMASG